MPDLSRAETMKAEIQEKINKLIADFSEGKISTEQFNLIYGRYHNQISLAEQALEEESPQDKEAMLPTIAILDATRGKAIGMAIYHHGSGRIIETLGTFDVPSQVLSPILHDITDKLESRNFVDSISKKLASGIWVTFLTRQFTTAILVFTNEPARLQMRQIQRLHHDFEEANRRLLEKSSVDSSRLARPFQGFVREKLK